jgi:hypothetical protein
MPSAKNKHYFMSSGCLPTRALFQPVLLVIESLSSTLIPGRRILDRLVILFVKDVKTQVTARIQEADRPTLRRQTIYSVEDLIRQPLELEVSLHVDFLHRLGYYRNASLDGPGETDLCRTHLTLLRDIKNLQNKC